MPRTICKTVYKFDELSDKAKEKALEWARTSLDYGRSDENADTLKAFCDIFPVKVKSWEYGWGTNISYSLTCDDEVENLSGIRLAKYIWNNYKADIYKGKYYSTKGQYIDGKYTYKYRHSKIILEASCALTGYCIDEDILQPIYDFLKNPKAGVTFAELIDDCLHAWLKACEDDYEAYYSDESLADHITANEYEFYEDGEIA
jgi:hypothetical protein